MDNTVTTEDIRRLDLLRQKIAAPLPSDTPLREVLRAQGYTAHLDDPNVIARAWAIDALFTGAQPFVYEEDLVVGSVRGLYAQKPPEGQQRLAHELAASYGERHFGTNFDHYAPDHAAFLAGGVPGVLQRIAAAQARHAANAEKTAFLQAAEITMKAFVALLGRYGDAAAQRAETAALPAARAELLQAAGICRKLADRPPETFREALQLVFLLNTAFVWEGRYAMAFGRMDQYLYPYYQSDLQAHRLTRPQAVALLANAFVKLAEAGRTDISNIAIGGVLRDGSGGVDPLSYDILAAVTLANVPGPNLSARLYRDAPDAFLDACLQAIGTGIGYPALMNDEVNIPALLRQGYALEDCRDYCMVGCIENFLPGQQPPWSDGRYNSPKYLELALNDGVCMQTGLRLGPATGTAETLCSMEDYMQRLERQMQAGAARYMALFRNENDRYNRKNYQSPFLSCFDGSCIERGLDINDGGCKYPSAHGAGCMGIGTMADALAAMEQVVFTQHLATPAQLRDALQANFAGWEDLRRALLAAPKYGNNHPLPDKYAVWFLRQHARLFDSYRTPDGGRVYVAIASNISNIPAGLEVAATADGRGSGEPLSDAASPMHGMDRKGPTAVILSTTRPDYTLAACGTVMNQKYSPDMFRDPEKRKKLLALIRVYMEKGGQEIQINAVGRDTLLDAMDHPERYTSLVVRVSGFSAFYVTLDRAVQQDILQRTEQG